MNMLRWLFGLPGRLVRGRSPMTPARVAAAVQRDLVRRSRCDTVAPRAASTAAVPVRVLPSGDLAVRLGRQAYNDLCSGGRGWSGAQVAAQTALESWQRWNCSRVRWAEDDPPQIGLRLDEKLPPNAVRVASRARVGDDRRQSVTVGRLIRTDGVSYEISAGVDAITVEGLTGPLRVLADGFGAVVVEATTPDARLRLGADEPPSSSARLLSNVTFDVLDRDGTTVATFRYQSQGLRPRAVTGPQVDEGDGAATCAELIGWKLDGSVRFVVGPDASGADLEADVDSATVFAVVPNEDGGVELKVSEGSLIADHDKKRVLRAGGRLTLERPTDIVVDGRVEMRLVPGRNTLELPRPVRTIRDADLLRPAAPADWLGARGAERLAEGYIQTGGPDPWQRTRSI